MAVSTATAELTEFAEGSINLGDSKVWFCMTHEQKMKVGHECPFCLHDQYGDVIFAHLT